MFMHIFFINGVRALHIALERSLCGSPFFLEHIYLSTVCENFTPTSEMQKQMLKTMQFGIACFRKTLVVISVLVATGLVFLNLTQTKYLTGMREA